MRIEESELISFWQACWNWWCPLGWPTTPWATRTTSSSYPGFPFWGEKTTFGFKQWKDWGRGRGVRLHKVLNIFANISSRPNILITVNIVDKASIAFVWETGSPCLHFIRRWGIKRDKTSEFDFLTFEWVLRTLLPISTPCPGSAGRLSPLMTCLVWITVCPGPRPVILCNRQYPRKGREHKIGSKSSLLLSHPPTPINFREYVANIGLDHFTIESG